MAAFFVYGAGAGAEVSEFRHANYAACDSSVSFAAKVMSSVLGGKGW